MNDKKTLNTKDWSAPDNKGSKSPQKITLTTERVIIHIAPYKKIILLTVFGLSGAAALIYEVVWSRSLQFIFGSTIETASTIFSAFLSGFALGSFSFRDMADRTEKPLFYIAIFEIGIGLYGFLMPFMISALAFFYYQYLSNYTFLRIILCIMILIIPATLFGSIWPFLGRYYVQRSPRIEVGTGSIYSVNSLCSALGALMSGFLLIPFLGIRATSFVAASINVLAGILILFVKEDHNEK